MQHSSPARVKGGSISRRRSAGSAFVCAFFGTAVLLGTAPATGIVIRHDRSDANYVVDPERYPQLFHLQERNQRKVCMATLIAPRWAITAGHCIDDTPLRSTLDQGRSYALQVAGSSYTVDQLVVHPEYRNGSLLQGVDLALLRLDHPVADVVPVALQRIADEVQHVATLVGWGSTGTGTSGRQRNDGKFRRAENRVDVAGEWLEIHFDDPRLPDSPALALEGVPGLGDSGGPALLDQEGALTLIGIAVGEVAREGGDQRQGLYGATGVYERISLHAAWIDSVIAADTSPDLTLAPDAAPTAAP
jgi:secreted trypsin-like serine protease